MKINILNKTLIKSVALASCFAALSLSSAQAADFYAGPYQNYTHNGIIAPEGGSIHAFSSSSLTFNNSMLGSSSGGKFNILCDNDYYNGNSNAARVYFNDSTVYANDILLTAVEYSFVSRMDLNNTNLYVSDRITLETQAIFTVINSNVVADIYGYGAYENRIELTGSNITGHLVGSIELWSYDTASFWTSIGSSYINSIELSNGGSLYVDFVMNGGLAKFSVDAIYGGIVDVYVNFTDAFIEHIIGYEGGSFGFNIFDTIVGDTDNMYWDIVQTNGNYSWSVTEQSAGYYVIYDITANVIPEPSTYAAIFGVLALGFAIYRRRK